MTNHRLAGSWKITADWAVLCVYPTQAGDNLMRILAVISAIALLCGCVAREQPAAQRTVDIGLTNGYSATVVASGLMNPSFVSFRPGSGAVTICDTGNGRVLLLRENGAIEKLVDGMTVEYWKPMPEGQDLYRVGPLSAVWIDDGTLAVTDGGKPDGQESVVYYRVSGYAAEETGRTNTIGPTTDLEIDLGEGNLSGMSVSADGNWLWVCGQGSDDRTWMLRSNIAERTLETFLAAGDHEISARAAMQALPWRGNLLVLYSGESAVNNGMIVEWDINTREPLTVWKLPELVDPMGMAQVPGAADEFIVTDNNWNLNRVNEGKLARVKLGDGGEKTLSVIADKLLGPVHCAFGPDGRLYVTCLGEEFDSDKGVVLAVSGF